MENTAPIIALRRALSLPWLVFYGVGVTVGAGIFALIGEVVSLAGDFAPMSFLIAGAVAGLTGWSYMLLAGEYPRAAGEAVFAKLGLGSAAGRIVGYGVVAVAVTAGATIGLAFARYLASFTGIPEPVGLVAVLMLLAAIAIAGVRESVGFAAVVTILEVGTLLVLIAVGLPMLGEAGVAARIIALPGSHVAISSVVAGAFVAFFAFIGFENIVNMAEETKNPQRAVPLAIILTLVISVVLYGLVASVAVAFPDRVGFTSSEAPLAALFFAATGWPGTPVAAMASIAMVNGILVQIVMASRVLYGMSREALLPPWFEVLHETRQTPARAILMVAAATAVLALSVPLLRLAELTSLVMLLIYTTVNVSLFSIGCSKAAPERIRRWRYWGLLGAAISLGLIVAEFAR